MSKPTVFIVDDDQEITYGVALRLRSAGYEARTAGDGAEGVPEIIASQPDVVLMDVRMPRVDGLAALEMLRADPRSRHIPIIMLSASLRDQETALEAGAHYFLTKPFRSRDLLTAIEVVLKKELQELPS
jgi:CheY-like chemotaxis protein